MAQSRKKKSILLWSYIQSKKSKTNKELIHKPKSKLEFQIEFFLLEKLEFHHEPGLFHISVYGLCAPYQLKLGFEKMISFTL